jgi:hypothetical protein
VNRRIKILIGLAVAFAVAAAAYVWFSPLAIFARRISDADRAVVSLAPEHSVSITLTGEPLARVVSMVSSGHRATKPYDCSPVAAVKFFKGSEMLGQMTTCLQLMRIGNRQYRDYTRLLEVLIVNPLFQAKRELEIQQAETK